MNLTWPQLHPMNYQFFRSVENYLINCPQIDTWMFDGYQASALLGFKLIDHTIFEPVLLNLPDLQKQHLAQFAPANPEVPENLYEKKLLLTTAQDAIWPQNHLCTKSLIDPGPKETEQKEDPDQQSHPALEIWKHFDKIEDPRADANQRHKLVDIVTIAILAVICGADDWGQIEEFGISKHEWLSTFLELEFGIPSHDTFNRLFARLDPDQFRAGFISWVNSIRKVISEEVIAI